MSTESKTAVNATIARLSLSVRAEFIPWSHSRNAGEKSPSLNWKVTVVHQGRDILVTDYMAGCGHCPSYRQGDRSIDRADMVRRECEVGKSWTERKPILPDPADVLYSLATDAEVIDAASFEDWVADTGYDPDSRAAEKIYRSCLDIALKLRAALGDAGLKELREAFQDY